MNGLTPLCSYCGKFSRKVTGETVYPHRPDLSAKTFYQCVPCDAYVGTHPGTDIPLGRLANAELRRWKSLTHLVFDPLWQSERYTRKEAYTRLGILMGLVPDECHIGMFNIEQCRRAIAFSEGGLT